MSDGPIPRHVPQVPMGANRLQRIIERGNARRRRHRRRIHGAQALAVAIAALVVAAGVLSLNHSDGRGATQVSVAGPGTTPAPSKAPPTSTLPSAGRVLKSGFGLAPDDAALLASWGSTLYTVVRDSGDTSTSVTLQRIGAQGMQATNTVKTPLSPYVASLSAGPDGLYAGTSVLDKFTTSPDELIRFDTASLSVTATKTFSAAVQPVATRKGLWASIGDGRIVRLDPKTLTVLASAQVRPAATALQTTHDHALSRPALGLGSLWVLAGDESDLELVRMNPATLAVLSRTKVPTGGQLYQELNEVVADQAHVYLTGGGAVTAVNADGTFAQPPVLVPGLQPGAQVYGAGLVGMVADPKSSGVGPVGVVLFDAAGAVLARTPVANATSPIALTGSLAWFQVDAEAGLVEFQLAGAPTRSATTNPAPTAPTATSTTVLPAPR